MEIHMEPGQFLLGVWTWWPKDKQGPLSNRARRQELRLEAVLPTESQAGKLECGDLTSTGWGDPGDLSSGDMKCMMNSLCPRMGILREQEPQRERERERERKRCLLHLTMKIPNISLGPDGLSPGTCCQGAAKEYWPVGEREEKKPLLSWPPKTLQSSLNYPPLMSHGRTWKGAHGRELYQWPWLIALPISFAGGLCSPFCWKGLQAHLVLLCFTDTEFLQIEGLWQPCVEQFYWNHFSNSVCSLCVSVPCFANSCSISNPLQPKDYELLRLPRWSSG